MSTIDAIRELMAKATEPPGTWKICEDSAGGKDEAWCHWHTIGPLDMTGKQPDHNGRLVLAAINALPALLAVASAAQELGLADTQDYSDEDRRVARALAKLEGM